MTQASSRLRLLITGLPPQTSTLDIYENLCQHGSVVRIHLFETREGFNSTRAEVEFQPAPSRPFWRHSIAFETRSGAPTEVHCQLTENQPQSHFHESPVRKGVKYEERTELVGTRLDFGVLSNPQTMMIMGTSGTSQHLPRLVLNLYRREIEFQFPWEQVSRTRSATRTFRFAIALDDGFKLWQLPDRSFVFHLKSPPWYSKQLAEAIANTHNPDARLWSIEDTWARQTDLCTYTQRIPEINGLPIALQKHLNDINIFRWTTFRFDPTYDHLGILTAKTIVAALNDWNVKVLDGSSFNLTRVQADLDKHCWRLINSIHRDRIGPVAAEASKTVLPFSVRYQLEVCISNGWLSEYSITYDFLTRLSEWPELRAKQALLYVALDQKRLFDPMTIFDDIHYSKPVRAKRLPDGCIEVCSATVTSTGVIFHTPAVEITNRIIRNHKAHAHRFLRVRFEDDEYRGQTRLYPSTNNKMIMIFTRVKRALNNGIKIGDITYDFLAWGNSQLREHGAYFFAAEDDLTADSIRAEMGDFKETVVAKKAARMGQCFSTTRPIRLQLRMVNEPDTIPDIIRNGYTFTDGVGKISPEAATLVASQLQIKGPTPCLFQFRLGGCKGVLAVSTDVPGVDVQIRKSQLKFSSLANELEINRYAQFWQAFLNRQIIICLSSLGVPTEVFIRKQDETIKALNQAMQDDGIAINALRSNIDPNMMTLTLSHMVEAGFREVQEPFVVSLLELWRAWSLKSLKEKAKIPVEKGAFLLGTVDETATLQGHTDASPTGDRETISADKNLLSKLPEIFLQYTDHKTGQKHIVEGICLLARNPSLHRGDIRIVRARNVVDLHHMCDVVVMPQLGDRDLASMCSGGDLDGDDYIVIWDEELIPRFWNAEPFHYNPPTPKTAAGEIRTSDLIDFFHDYMQNDALGKIAHAHLAAADFLDDGLESEICLDLVQLHSMAVDYPKTGVPAKMERRLERTQKPHFMEQKHGKPYHSDKVLGQLYDRINKFYVKVQKESFIKHDLEFDPRILNAMDTGPELTAKVEAVKREYDIALQRALTQHNIQTEFELWSTFVLEHSKKSRDYKFHEEVGELSRVLKEEYYEELCDVAGGRDFDHLAPVAVTAYRITREQLRSAQNCARSSGNGPPTKTPFISFPWVLQETLIKIAGQINPHKKSDSESAKNRVNEAIKVALESVDDGKQREIHDIADLRITRDKLSPYLPDPLTSNIVVAATSTLEADTSEVPLAFESKPGSVVAEGLLVDEFDQTATTKEHSLSAFLVSSNSDCQVPEVLTDGVEYVSEAVASAGEPQSGTTSWDLDTFERLIQGKQAQQSCHRDNASTQGPRPPIATTSYHPRRSSGPKDNRKKYTCFYWKTSGCCRFSAAECKYAHHDTGNVAPEKRQMTCYFWFNKGKCAHSDDSCKFAHHDTGYYAPPPINSPKNKSNAIASKRVIVENSDNDDEDYVVVRNPKSPSLTSSLIDPNTHQRTCDTKEVSIGAAGRPQVDLVDTNPAARLYTEHRIDPKLKDFVSISLPLRGESASHQLSSNSTLSRPSPLDQGQDPGPTESARIDRPHGSSFPKDKLASCSWTQDLKDLVFDAQRPIPRNGQDPKTPRSPVEFSHNLADSKLAPYDESICPFTITNASAILPQTVDGTASGRPSSQRHSRDLSKGRPLSIDKEPQVVVAKISLDSSPNRTHIPLSESAYPMTSDGRLDTQTISPDPFTAVKTYQDPLTGRGESADEPEIDELFD